MSLTAGFSLFPFVMSPKYNYVNSFVVDLFNFESEKTRFWLLFRILYTIVVFLDAFISMGTILIHAIWTALVAHLQTSWLSHFVTVTFSSQSVYKLVGFYKVLSVLNTTCQSVIRFFAPVFVGFCFIVTLICNVIALSTFHKMDTLIYIFCVLCGSGFFIMTMMVMQFWAKSAGSSANCIKGFENVVTRCEAKQIRKILKSLRLINFEMGSFYLISMDMVLTYNYHILDKTISALLLM